MGGESPGTQARPVGGSTLNVADGSAFGSPSPESPIRIVVMRGENNAFVTILKLVGRSGEAFTIDGPSDAHADAEILVDDRIVAALTAEGLAEIQAAIDNVETTPGDDGADGTKWQIGETAPDDSLGVDGDFYINSTTQDVSLKSSGTYAVQFNMKGAKGDPGDPGNPGEGVPTGGTTDQLLAKASGTDFDTKWVDAPEGGGGLTSIGLSMPGGFSVAESPLTEDGSFNVTTPLSGIVKASGGAFVAATPSVDYATPSDLEAIELTPGPGVPPGGTTNQLLAKASGTNYDGKWVDPPSFVSTIVDVATFLLGRFDVALTPGTNLTKSSKPAGFTGTITRVVVTCGSNPAGGGFSFQINVNGTGVFATAQTIAAETGLVGGSAVAFTEFANALFSVDDQFTIDCTAAGEDVKWITIVVYGTPS